MPGDNPATVGAGEAVDFPQDGPAAGGVARTDSNSFLLPQTGTYRVAFSVPVTEQGQLQLTLDGNPLAYTVAGRDTGASRIDGEALVQTQAPGSVIELVNPTGNAPALTITPTAGGDQPAAAWLIIEQLPVAPAP